MKRNKFFWVATPVAVLFILIASDGSANAQSKDRDNPARLTSNVISGTISPDKSGDNYHYTFVAGPGEVVITLTVESGREALNVVQVQFDLFDENANKLAGKHATASYSTGSEQVVERINITRRQPVLLRTILRNNYGRAGGTYRVRLGGAVSFSQNTLDPRIAEQERILNDSINATRRATASRGDVDNPECLPKKGILRVKMKDGSVRRIDLSQAEEITIEH